MSYQPTLQTLVSTANSSTATLTSGSVFTGTSENVSLYSEIRVYVRSDVASVTDGLSIQQSSDGTNWDVTDTYTVPLASGKTYGIGVSGTFFRIVYTNGGTNQTSFRLQCSFHAVRTKPSSVRPQDARGNDNDMEEVASYDMIYDPINNVWNRLVTSQAITGQAAQTAVVNNIIPVTASTAGTSVGPYVFGSVQIVSTGTGGTFIFESANSDASYTTMNVWNNTVLTGTPISAAITPTSSNITYYFPITSNFIRVRIATTITGGSIQAISKLNTTSPFPVTFQVAQATAANLNVTATGTITAVTTLANGQTAHSSASTGSPLRIAGRVLPTTPDLTLAPGDVSDTGITSGQQLLTKDFASSELDYTFNGSISNSTTAAIFKAAAGASIRSYVTGIVVNSDTLTAATEIVIKDGTVSTTSLTTNTFTSGTHDYKIGDQVVFSNIASYTGITVATIYYVLTVPSVTTYTISLTPNGAQVTGLGGTGTATSNRILFRSKLQTTSFGPASFIFPSPLRGLPNGTLDFQTVTATIAGAVYYNIQGYIGF